MTGYLRVYFILLIFVDIQTGAMTNKKENTAKKETTAKKKVGLPKGRTNNPAGRPKGSKNKIQFDVRKAIYEKVSKVEYIDEFFNDIDMVEDADKRAKLKLDVLKLFVPRPLNDDEQKDSDIRSAMYAKLAGEVSKEE